SSSIRYTISSFPAALTATTLFSPQISKVGGSNVTSDTGLTFAVTGILYESQSLVDAPTKNIVVSVIVGVSQLAPVPITTPPVSSAYQFIVPPEAVADKFTAPSPQRSLFVMPVMFTLQRC